MKEKPYCDDAPEFAGGVCGDGALFVPEPVPGVTPEGGVARAPVLPAPGGCGSAGRNLGGRGRGGTRAGYAPVGPVVVAAGASRGRRFVRHHRHLWRRAAGAGRRAERSRLPAPSLAGEYSARDWHRSDIPGISRASGRRGTRRRAIAARRTRARGAAVGARPGYRCWAQHRGRVRWPGSGHSPDPARFANWAPKTVPAPPTFRSPMRLPPREKSNRIGKIPA